jgi:hypothetical protein
MRLVLHRISFPSIMHAQERPNRSFRHAVMMNPLAATPLFESAVETAGGKVPAVPPRMLKRPSATQMESFEKLLGSISLKQHAVLDALRAIGRPATTNEIAEHLHWTINLVSGRIAELTEMGYVREHSTVWNESTRRHRSLWDPT